MITYFIGCGWYLTCRYINTDADNKADNTFIKSFQLDELIVDTDYCNKDECAKLIKDCKDPNPKDKNFFNDVCTESEILKNYNYDCSTVDESDMKR